MNSGQRRKHHRHCLREFGMAPTQLREYWRYMNDGTQFGLRPGEILPVFIFQKPGKTFRYEEPSASWPEARADSRSPS